MLNALIRLSLKYRLLIVFVSLATLLYGSYVMATLPIDVLPDLDRPRVVLITECPGFAPEDVETLVTFPLESRLNGATGVESVRSQSGPGISVIYVNFHWGTDIYVARQVVQERINGAQLPEGFDPQMAPISSLLGQVLFIGLSRRDGPTGGRLAPVPETPYVAELAAPGDGEARLRLWDPRGADGRREDDVKAWRPVRADARDVPLRWQDPDARAGAVGQATKGNAPLTPEGGGQVFAGPAELPAAAGELAFRADLWVEGKERGVTFASDRQSQMELRTLADWVVRLRLLKVNGVAQVVSMGGGRKQYQVLADPGALLRFGVTLEEVGRALAANNVSSSGGWALKGDKEQPIRFLGRLGPTTADTLAQLRKVPVKTTGGRVVLVEQVARVAEAPQLQRGDASVNGRPGVVLMVTRQPHVDTRHLTTVITDALADLGPSLPPDVAVNPELFQMKRFIDLGVFNVVEALAIGAALVLVVLFLFLLNVRTTFISLTAIPLSLAITAIVFEAVSRLTGTQLTINVMTLGGIAVAMGELVDDAIVDVENIFRRLRENATLDSPRPVARVIYDASVEVRSAIVFGTAVVILVFLPLFALSGIEGRLFSPLGVAYIVSILASLVVSLTVTPVMSYYLLRGTRGGRHGGDSPLLRGLKWASAYLIRLSMARPGLILLATWVLVGVSAWALTQLGSDFLPPFDEGSVQVNVSLPPGASLAASNEAMRQVDAAFRTLQKTPDNPDGFILNFVRRTGRAELDEHVAPVSDTEYILTIDPESPLHREEILKRIHEDLEELRLGAFVEAEQPLAHFISHMMTGVTAQIAIRVYGDDLTTLRQTADRIKAAIEDVPGIAPPVVEAQQMVEELHVKPRPEAWEQYGVDRAHLADFVRTALYGDVVSEVVEKERRYDLVLRLDEPYRSDYHSLDGLVVETPEGRGGPVTLGMLADVEEGLGANAINRDNVRRRIVIRVNTLGRDLGGAVQDIRQRVRERVTLPEGYFVEYGGQFESQQRAAFLIPILAGISFVAMFVVLYMLFPSWRVVAQILNALPTAFIGGVLALVLTGQRLNVAAMVGFISLGGIAVRNGILLVSHYLHLMKYEGEGFSREMVLRGSLERLAPVLMTALTAGCALIPLVVAGHEPGREILYPVATVIFGGLITSTFCEFLVHPGLFWRFSGSDAEALVREMEAELGQEEVSEVSRKEHGHAFRPSV